MSANEALPIIGAIFSAVALSAALWCLLEAIRFTRR